MSFSRGAAALSAILFVVNCCTHFICHSVDVMYFAESFSLTSLHARCQVKSKIFQSIHSTNSGNAGVDEQNLTTTTLAHPNFGDIDEAQVLLACRAYLRRKHKIEWTAKKQRAEAASSPLNNEGYFWYDPNELMYLREDPDPYNLNYNIGTNGRRERKAGPEFVRQIFDEEDFLNSKPLLPDVQAIAFSTNPFATTPLHAPEEHVRRSTAKESLWNNETWKELWYKRRWRGKVLTDEKKSHKRRGRLLDSIPGDVLNSPMLDQLSEDEVMEATITYMRANQRRSESRKRKKLERREQREVTREWKRNVKQQAIQSSDAKNATKTQASRQKTKRRITRSALSFTPSVETLILLREKRSEQSKRAFQTRLINTNSSETSSWKEIAKLRRHYERDCDDDSDDISPIQAILRIDMALDHNKLPSAVDVEVMLKPGRLGRRRTVLRRILNDCFDLRGKCVPSSFKNSSNEKDFLFVTKCSIDELGSFVLSKMSEKTLNE
jgi:hypothetical protein